MDEQETYEFVDNLIKSAKAWNEYNESKNSEDKFKAGEVFRHIQGKLSRLSGVDRSNVMKIVELRATEDESNIKMFHDNSWNCPKGEDLKRCNLVKSADQELRKQQNQSQPGEE